MRKHVIWCNEFVFSYHSRRLISDHLGPASSAYGYVQQVPQHYSIPFWWSQAELQLLPKRIDFLILQHIPKLSTLLSIN